MDGFLLMLLAVVGGVVAVTLGLAYVASRRQRGRAAAAQAASQKDLAIRANAGLLELDDLVGDMDAEASFAEAEFGESAAAPLRKALDGARQELAASFALRQKLDDATPEDDATRTAMLKEIADRTARGKASLDAQRAAVANLRAIEERAPEILDALPAKADALDARYAAAEATLARVQADYAASVWEPVDGNLAEAGKRVAVVRDARERGKQALTSGETRTGAQLAVASEIALSEADGLLGAVERLAKDADAAKAGVPGVLAEVGADLASARASLPSAAPGSELPGKVAALEATVAGINAEMAQPRPDVVDAYRKAVAAAQDSDAILAGIRSEAERVARERATLDMTLQAADRDVRRATDFVAARRAGVDREARTRLAEAQRHLENAQALAAKDVAAATRRGAPRRPARAAGDAARDDGLHALRPDVMAGAAAAGGATARAGSTSARSSRGSRSGRSSPAAGTGAAAASPGRRGDPRGASAEAAASVAATAAGAASAGGGHGGGGGW